MIIIAILLVLCCIYKLKLSKYHSDYMSFGQTESIKGIFAVIILLSHLRQYVPKVFQLDYPVLVLLNYMGQLMVAMFFFYSSYGIIHSFRKKADYTKNFFKNRVLKTLLHFDIAVFLYLVLSLVLGQEYSPVQYLLCWTGWTSLGNSNWFVFVILCLYCIAGIALLVLQNIKSDKKAVYITIACSCLSVLLWIALRACGKESFWYNTLLCFPIGMWFSVYKESIDHILQKNTLLRVCCILTVLALCVIFYFMKNEIAFSICACMFSLLLVLITMHIKVDNPILRWLGKHSFEIYIIQRFPMILFSHLGLDSSPLLFLLLSVAATGGLAVGLKQVYKILDHKLFKKMQTVY